MSRGVATSGLCLALSFFLAAGCGSENDAAELDTDGTVRTSTAVQQQAEPQQLLIAATGSGGTASSQEQKPQAGTKVTFVELGSVNCIPCKQMQPIMKEIEVEYNDQVKVVFHDVWTEQGKPYAEKFRIRVIPTQVFLDKDGKEYFRHEGFFPKDQLVEVLKKQGVK
jgi:thioredoxin 1